MIRSGNDLGNEMCQALGIDPRLIHTIEIRMNCQEVAEVTTIGYASIDAVPQIKQRYALVKRAGWAPPWPPPRLGEVYYK